MKLITRSDPKKVEERRAQLEQLKAEMDTLESDIRELDRDDPFDRPILEEKTGRLKLAKLQQALIEPELALAAADKTEQTRIEHLERDYELAWNEYNLYYLLRETPVIEADVAALKRRIAELKSLKEKSEQV